MSDDGGRHTVPPPPGVSFATHSVDLDARTKELVAERLVAARWNEYVSPDPIRAAERIARLLVPHVPPRAVALHRGAEAALRAHCERIRPSRLWWPSHAYPGFARITEALRLATRQYDSVTDLAAVDAGDLVVVTEPTSPVSIGDTASLLRAGRDRGGHVVVDATFALLTPPTLRRLQGLRDEHHSAVVLSTSKSAGLAAARLGVLVAEPGAVPQRITMEWDVFQCALLDVLLDGGRLIGRLHEVAREQTRLQRQLIAALDAASIPVLDGSNAFAVTALVEPGALEVLGSDGWKAYEANRIRIDANATMISRIASTSR